MIGNTINRIILITLLFGYSVVNGRDVKDSLRFPNQMWLNIGGTIRIGGGYT
jgi:hypothetical protein